MSNKILLLCVLVVSVACSQERSAGSEGQMIEAQQKAKLTSSAITAIQQLHSIASADAANIGDVNTNPRRQKLGQEISKILVNLRSVDELGLVARVAYSIAYPNSAETLRYDEVFYIAYEQCIQKLRAMNDNSANDTLLLIKGQLKLSHHESELIDNRGQKK